MLSMYLVNSHHRLNIHIWWQSRESCVSQFTSSPKHSHMVAVERVLRYLKCTPGQGILLRKEGPLELEAYCDADWAGGPTHCAL